MQMCLLMSIRIRRRVYANRLLTTRPPPTDRPARHWRIEVAHWGQRSETKQQQQQQQQPTNRPLMVCKWGVCKWTRRDTGFTLWRDTIDNLSNYESPQPTFHTMRLSTDHRIIAGLSFDCPRSAQQLFDQVKKKKKKKNRPTIVSRLFRKTTVSVCVCVVDCIRWRC